MLNDVQCGDLLKVLWYDGQGLCLFAKRLEKGRFVWPSPADGKVAISPAQLGMLLEGIDWRMPRRTWRPELAGYPAVAGPAARQIDSTLGLVMCIHCGSGPMRT